MSINDDGKTARFIERVVLRGSVLLALGLAVLLMTACSNETLGDLEAYTQEVKARKAGRIPPMPEVKQYQAYAYKKDNLRDPFSPSSDSAFVEGAATGGLQPDKQRNKEPLESFPLDSLRFVGHLEQEGRVWAIVTAPDALVYRVEEGNYIGTNFGRIVGISETQIDVREIVPDGLGGWVERDAAVMLAE